MTSQKIEFKNTQGLTLAANLELPPFEVRAYAIFAHCFSCSKDFVASKRISQRLASLGIAVLRFDFTGLGHSEGEFANTNFTTNLYDIQSAADHLRAHFKAPELLIGHSFGGAAVLRARALIPEIKAVATIGAPASPSHIKHLFQGLENEINDKGICEIDLGHRKLSISRSFLSDLKNTNHNPDQIHHKLSGSAVLVMHSPVDQIVGIENASEIFTTAKHPKSFISLNKADHLLTDPNDANYVAEQIATWVQRYLPEPALIHPKEALEGIVRSQNILGEKFLQNVSINGIHSLLADEPTEYGGKNEGPSPYQFLSTALATCTSMTIQMYSERKGIELGEIYVDVSHEKIHKNDSEKQEKIDHFNRKITFNQHLNAQTKKRLIEIADRCPVHRTLESSAKISTELAIDD